MRRPPALARWLLARLSPEHLRTAYLDDLDELFVRQHALHRRWRSHAWYWAQLIRAVIPLLRLRYRARRTRTQENPRMSILDSLTRNVRYATRLLVRSPGFTVAAALTLGLGIGANTAIFSVVKAVMLTPLPYANPDELVMLWQDDDAGERTWLSLQEVVSYRDNATSLASVGGYIDGDANLTGGREPERVRSATVTGELFATLGVDALRGRGIVSDDSAPDATDVAVLSHGLWQRRFGGAPDVIGETLHVNGRPRTIVGVMPPRFRLPLDFGADRPTDLWLSHTVDRGNLGEWGSRSYLTVARLKPGVEPATATSELRIIADRWIQAGFVQDQGDGRLFRSAVPLQPFIIGDVRRPLLILLGAVGVVLLIASANVVNLLLARADRRRREVALRAALGAERRDLIGQLLTESVLLSLIGGALGVMLAAGAMRAMMIVRPAGLPRVEEASLDLTVLAFTATLSLVIGIVFGLLPASHLTGASFAAVLNESGRGGARGQVRLAVRRGLVIAQLAFSLVLIVAAGLLLRTLIALNQVDLGFNPRGVLTAQLQLPVTDYADVVQVNAFYRRLTERLAQLPGVTAAGAVRILPLSRTIGDWSISVEGRETAPNENPNGDFQFATPGYFAAMGYSLVRGRWFTAADREDAPPVVLVNDTMAARYWPGEDAIGKRFRMGGPGTTRPPMTIVGIVKTSRHNAVLEEPRAEMYLPQVQLPQSAGFSGRGMAVVLKTEHEPLALADALRDAVRELDRNLPVADVRTLEEVTADALAAPRFASSLLGLFALLAAALAAIGTYATISLLVAERSHEIGIRIALGAERRRILTSILREGLVLAAAGIGIGIGAAVLFSRALHSLLYGVEALDPLTFAAMPAVLALIALLASLIPARRAACIDPVNTLRHG